MLTVFGPYDIKTPILVCKSVMLGLDSRIGPQGVRVVSAEQLKCRLGIRSKMKCFLVKSKVISSLLGNESNNLRIESSNNLPFFW